jgi:hypothetical protein
MECEFFLMIRRQSHQIRFFYPQDLKCNQATSPSERGLSVRLKRGVLFCSLEMLGSSKSMSEMGLIRLAVSSEIVKKNLLNVFELNVESDIKTC